jgi:putative chitinase
MKISELVIEADVSRRRFIGGIAGAGALGAGYNMMNYMDKHRPNFRTIVEPAPEVEYTPQPRKFKNTDSPEVRQMTLIRDAYEDGLRGDELAQFMAQCAYETGNFRWMTELGNVDRYHSRIGNQGIEDADRYRGRGFIHLTGRANYRSAGPGTGLGLDFERDPDYALLTNNASRIALWFWRTRVRPRIRDFRRTAAVTRIIKGSTETSDRRDRLFKEYRARGLDKLGRELATRFSS